MNYHWYIPSTVVCFVLAYSLLDTDMVGAPISHTL